MGAAIATIGLLLLAPEDISVAQAPESEITICGDLVPQELRDANATFEVFYELSTDASGKAARVTKLKNDILPDARLIACLRKWTLPTSNAKVKVSMTWEHAKGWTRFTIAMPGHPSRQITMEPGWPF
jgi:hypothetical protein